MFFQFKIQILPTHILNDFSDGWILIWKQCNFGNRLIHSTVLMMSPYFWNPIILRFVDYSPFLTFWILQWDPNPWFKILIFPLFSKQKVFKIYQKERDYYSTNLSILNISSYSDWNLFWDAKILRTLKLWQYSSYKSSNF